MKARRQPIVMVTAYDAPGGRLADQAGADLVLVGDSAAMTVLGHDSTVPATMDEMLILTRAVTRGASRPLVIADMPFGSFQVSDEDAVRNAIRFVKEAGADAVKLEGAGAMLSRVRGDRRRRDPGDGPHRPDAAVGHDAGRLQGAGALRREGGRAPSRRPRARGRRLLLARPRGRPVAGRGTDLDGARDTHDRHRRRSRLRRPGARLARPARSVRGPSCSLRQALRGGRRYDPLRTRPRTPRTSASAASRRSSTPTPCPTRSSRSSRRTASEHREHADDRS